MPDTAATRARNPFGVMDVPSPDDDEAARFAASASLSGAPDDINAPTWASLSGAADRDIDGVWCSRWKGGADPTIAGDAPELWKQGAAEVRRVGERVYLRFDWDRGARRGLIDARRTGDRHLVGKYINLTDPAIVRAWIGLIVDPRRIDGRWANGRLDFRR